MCFFNLSNVTDKMFQSVFQVIVSFVTTTTSSFSIGYHDQLKIDAGSFGLFHLRSSNNNPFNSVFGEYLKYLQGVFDKPCSEEEEGHIQYVPGLGQFSRFK